MVSATVGSLSQFGPSSPVSLKISVLTTPHSGLNMKRTDRMVGIDGTAQGRMNSTDSHLIQGRCWAKKPDRNSAIIILTLMPITQEDQRIDRGAREDRIVPERDIARRMTRQPQPVADRVDHEGQEHQQVGRQQHDAPDLRRGQPGRQRRAWHRLIARDRDRHIQLLLSAMPAAAYRQPSSRANAGTHNHRLSWLDESRRDSVFHNERHGVWVPAFAGTTWRKML